MPYFLKEHVKHVRLCQKLILESLPLPPSPFLSLDKEKGKNHIIKCLFVFDLVDIYTFQVLKESFKIYCAINDGIINLVDKVKWFIT